MFPMLCPHNDIGGLYEGERGFKGEGGKSSPLSYMPQVPSQKVLLAMPVKKLEDDNRMYNVLSIIVNWMKYLNWLDGKSSNAYRDDTSTTR